MRKLIALVIILLPLLSSAYTIVGQYRCKGLDPLSHNYNGKARITEDDNVYYIKWYLDDASLYDGKALLTGEILSVVYKEIDSTDKQEPIYGVMQYEVNGETLYGTWLDYNKNKLGKEICVKEKN